MQWKITYIIETSCSDPSPLLDGAHAAAEDLTYHIEATTGVLPTVDEDETCVERAESDDA